MEKLNSQEVLDEVRVETAQEMAERLQKEVDAYKEMVSTKETQEELDELDSKPLIDYERWQRCREEK